MSNLKSNDEMYDLYFKAYKNEINNYLKEKAINPNVDIIPFLKKIVTYGIKHTNLRYRHNQNRKYITRELAESEFECVDIIQSFIGYFTPREFMSLFPISKDYNGHKYQAKDYFYTKDYMNKLEKDKPLRDQVEVIELLWVYVNDEIFDFNMAILDCMDNLRKLDGELSLAEEFFQENGLKMHTLYTDEKGKKFLVDNETGKSTPVKTRPAYLKIKMGGKVNE